jgi:hypothetical protein
MREANWFDQYITPRYIEQNDLLVFSNNINGQQIAMSYSSPLLINKLTKPDSVELLSIIRREKPVNAEADYEEDLIQDLVDRVPDCLPIGEIDSAFAGMRSVCRELPVHCGDQDGFIDNLLVNPSGRICLVECKLWRNPEANRAVAAQILSYAAAISKFSYDDLVARIRIKMKTGVDPLVEKVLGSGTPEEDRQKFRQDVDRGLRRGNFMLLIVSDGIRAGVQEIATLFEDAATLAFTFGLIEMPIYRTHDDSRFFVQPRLLVQSRVATRTVFVAARSGEQPVIESVTAPSQPETISEVEFYRELAQKNSDFPDRLRGLLDRLRAIGCDIKLLRKFNAYIDDVNGGQVSIGWFGRDGTLEIWGIAARDKDRGSPLGLQYMQKVATIFGGSVQGDLANPSDLKIKVNDRVGIPLSIVLAHADTWLAAITEFSTALRQISDREAK